MSAQLRRIGLRRGVHSLARSVEQFLFGSIVFAESAPPPHREFGRITGHVDRTDGRRKDEGTGGRQINKIILGVQEGTTADVQKPWTL